LHPIEKVEKKVSVLSYVGKRLDAAGADARRSFCSKYIRLFTRE